MKSPTAETLLGMSHTDQRLDFKNNGVSPPYNMKGIVTRSHSRIRDNEPFTTNMGSTVEGSAHPLHKFRGAGKKMRPVLWIDDKTGEVMVDDEYVRGKKDEYGLSGNNLIDNHCKDNKIKMLIYKSKLDHKRYKVLNNLQAQEDEETFQDYYKKIRGRVKNSIEEEKRAL